MDKAKELTLHFHSFSLEKKILWVLGILVLINILVLNFLFLKFYSALQILEGSLSKSATSDKSQVLLTDTNSCPSSCLKEIKSASEALTTPKETTKSLQPVIQTSNAKEFFVPLGAGSSDITDWTDVAGAQAYVDKSQYYNVKQILFEASVSVPAKNEFVDVRLYNVTDKHPVWFSDVHFPSGSDPLLLVSSPIILEDGNKLYQVQMKTQLQYSASLDQSRIHIITK